MSKMWEMVKVGAAIIGLVLMLLFIALAFIGLSVGVANS